MVIELNFAIQSWMFGNFCADDLQGHEDQVVPDIRPSERRRPRLSPVCRFRPIRLMNLRMQNGDFTEHRYHRRLRRIVSSVSVDGSINAETGNSIIVNDMSNADDRIVPEAGDYVDRNQTQTIDSIRRAQTPPPISIIHSLPEIGSEIRPQWGRFPWVLNPLTSIAVPSEPSPIEHATTPSSIVENGPNMSVSQSSLDTITNDQVVPDIDHHKTKTPNQGGKDCKKMRLHEPPNDEYTYHNEPD
ncbi:hypothetical protein BLOT_005730 [Blomia tropicalis]|nr:hypothetical protein BLOT_005730 [Blomia tropicalis]